MKTLYALALASFLGLTASIAYAEDAATAQPRATKPIASAPAPVKISQQDKMRLCAKQATGKKGAERKTFMKGCLSKKA
ncbi:MAG TPA: PsiF family protein [Casimicrobiaceae bacterium]|nr:PsiF family protein [Casimicrobiaceae bacterium]